MRFLGQIAFAAALLGADTSAHAEQKTMRFSGFEVQYDDARWYGQNGGGFSALNCKPKACPSVQIIFFLPERRFSEANYKPLAEAAKSPNGIAKFLKTKVLGWSTEIKTAKATVQGNSATVTIEFALKQGTFTYTAYGKLFMNGPKMHGVFAASRTSGTTKALYAQGVAMLKRR